MLLKSPEVLKIIEGLGYSGANIQVIDAQRRVRAEVGSYSATQEPPLEPVQQSVVESWFSFVSALVDSAYGFIDNALREELALNEGQVILDALSGKPGFQQFLCQPGELINLLNAN